MTAPIGAFITPREAAHRLGVKLATVMKWCRMGYYKRYGVKGRVYYDWNEIIAHPLVAKDYGRFQEELARQLYEEFPEKAKNGDPVFYEPMYA